MSEFTTYHLFLMVKTKVPTPALIRSDAEDIWEHPASSESTKKRKNKNADHLHPQLQRIRCQEDGLPLIKGLGLGLVNIKFTKFNIPTAPPSVAPIEESFTSGNNTSGSPSVRAPDDAPSNSSGPTSEVGNAARRSYTNSLYVFANALKERNVISPSKGPTTFMIANQSSPLESQEFKGTSGLIEDYNQDLEDDNDSIISSTLAPTVPIEHYQEEGMDIYSDTIISNSPNNSITSINPLNPKIIVLKKFLILGNISKNKRISN
ncbi:hypothetical protein LY90DRAFT_636577 [Neocallimastix californiae]|uniref:Uncharacterized protein n=1 Tax=Neocallimastix californiae TaxID=1754190 RepID=A0A1Y1ZTW4_9FUNG|nr:hypothetical protein LY90DRAFT_636577 [Neocallimastix californiae]|eukprot:ORY13660.1 hypothetical protein LY90DRAFT_636577 [Neocallimastix californiae]